MTTGQLHPTKAPHPDDPHHPHPLVHGVVRAVAVQGAILFPTARARRMAARVLDRTTR